MIVEKFGDSKFLLLLEERKDTEVLLDPLVKDAKKVLYYWENSCYSALLNFGL
jgi:hypothetical protein